MKPFSKLAFSLSLLAYSLTSFALTKTEAPIYTEEKTNISVTADQPEFQIKLKSNPTTGYSWFLKEYHARYLQPVSHHYLASETQLMGAPGYELWTFKMKPEAFTVPLQTSLRFVYARPWEKNDQTPRVVFNISTRAQKN